MGAAAKKKKKKRTVILEQETNFWDSQTRVNLPFIWKRAPAEFQEVMCKCAIMYVYMQSSCTHKHNQFVRIKSIKTLEKGTTDDRHNIKKKKKESVL